MSHVFFTDRNLGKQFPAILAAAGLNVERHHDLFAPAGSDEEWLEYCGTKSRIAITHDQRIRHKVNERDAVILHKVALLIVIGKAPFPVLAHAFVASLPRIEKFLTIHTAPFIAKVYRPAPTPAASSGPAPGNIDLWYPK